MSDILRKNSLARKKPFRNVRSLVLILTEGKKTEVIYLNGVCRHLRLTNVEVRGPSGVPKTMVQKAVSSKSLYRDVWCVFDVDEHPNLDEALKQAKDNGIKVAVSNPCFEIFLILHWELYTKPCSRQEAQRRLKELDREYDKTFSFNDFWPKYGEAVRNQSKLDAWARSRGTQEEAPSTGVFRLIEFLVKLAEDVVLGKGDK